MNEEVIKYLESNSNNDTKEFNSIVIPGGYYPMIGVRIPIIRKYAKELSKKYDLDYLLDNIKNEYYETVLLKGILIGNYKKLTLEELTKYIDYYLPLIKDWSLCDSFVVSLKITKKYKNELFKYINKCLNSKKEYHIRFGLVMLLNYYIDDEYIDKIYEIVDSVTMDEYYVKMANAWLISYLFIDYFDKTIDYYKRSNIDKWTYNKGIQKSIESYRLDNEKKDILRSIRK